MPNIIDSTSRLSGAIRAPSTTTTTTSQFANNRDPSNNTNTQTAPVLEFSCLYTHDAKRKNAKRWHDGYLRFHCFNRRIMAYDGDRNYLGDTHAPAPVLAMTGGRRGGGGGGGSTAVDHDEGVVLEEGEEFLLDRHGVLVQVCVFLRKMETDLRAVVRSKGSPGRKNGPTQLQGQRVAAGGVCVQRKVGGGRTLETTPQQKHRSLKSLSGMNAGGAVLGKAALPTKSPFEERYALGLQSEREGPLRKKQRVEDAPEPGRRSRAAIPLKGQKNSRPDRYEQISRRDVHIDRRTGENSSEKFLAGLSSDVLQPLSSPEKDARQAPILISSSPPAPQRMATPARLLFASPVENRQRIRDPTKAEKPANLPLDANLYVGQDSARERSSSTEKSRANSPKGATLRLAPNKPKKNMLFCLDSLSKRPSTHLADGKENDGRLSPSDVQGKCGKGNGPAKSQRKLLEERMAKIQENPNNSHTNHDEPLLTEKLATTEPQQSVPTLPNGTSNEQDSAVHDESYLMDDTSLLESPSRLAPAIEHVTEESQAHPRKSPVTVPAPLIIPSKLRPPDAPESVTLPSKRAVTHVKAVSGSIMSGSNPAAHSEPSNARLQSCGNNPKEVEQKAAPTRKCANKSSGPVVKPPPPRPTKSTGRACAPPVAQPWSREAFDLFTWRPPGWDEEKWCVTTTNANPGAVEGP